MATGFEEDVPVQADELAFGMQVGYVSDPLEVNIRTDLPEVKTDDGQQEPLELYNEKIKICGERFNAGYRINVVKTDGTRPESLEKHTEIQ